MSFTVTLSVTGILKYFLAPLALTVGGLLGGVITAALLSRSKPSGSRTDVYATMGILYVGGPLGFLAGVAASGYFFGLPGLVLPGVLVALVGLYVFIVSR